MRERESVRERQCEKERECVREREKESERARERESVCGPVYLVGERGNWRERERV